MRRGWEGEVVGWRARCERGDGGRGGAGKGGGGRSARGNGDWAGVGVGEGGGGVRGWDGLSVVRDGIPRWTHGVGERLGAMWVERVMWSEGVGG